MRRDFDLMRLILLHVEATAPAILTGTFYQFEHDDRDAVEYALYLMEQRRLIETRKSASIGSHPADSYMLIKLTWDGHDFLDSVRDEEIWSKTKAGAKAAGGFTFDILKDLAKGLIKTQIKKHTDVDLDL